MYYKCFNGKYSLRINFHYFLASLLLRVNGPLDLGSAVSGSILTGGNILSLELFFFHVEVKPMMAILALLLMLCVCEKLECNSL